MVLGMDEHQMIIHFIPSIHGARVIVNRYLFYIYLKIASCNFIRTLHIRSVELQIQSTERI